MKGKADMDILKQANASYKCKNYEKALNLYEQAAYRYGSMIVDVNIILCKKALALQKKLTINQALDKISNYSNLNIDNVSNAKKETEPATPKKISKDELISSHRRVLLDAYNLTVTSTHEDGIAYAENFLPAYLAYTIEILRANAAISCGNEKKWLNHLNNYLKQFSLPPVYLDNKGTLLDRLTTAALPYITDGPLVTVIMAAWNAEDTIYAASCSILNQTWRSLELIIVDDASTDGTPDVLIKIAAIDKRVKIIHNKVNVGPYVSKNIALMHAKGDYVTGHDADDWAHPLRLENHLKTVLENHGKIKGSLTSMLRVSPEGFFDKFSIQNSYSPDGITRIAGISCLFETSVLRKQLGFWDSVRFGADSEMIARAKKILGKSFSEINQIGMICLSARTSLTNHSNFGIQTREGKMSPIRLAYKQAWIEWHKKIDQHNSQIDFPNYFRAFNAPAEMIVDLSFVNKILVSSIIQATIC